ncbi:aldo/keto reductase [Niabella aquatica]
MNYRNFHRASIAEIGLGTWQLGSADWGMVDEDKAFEILETYTAGGGNFIDTADVYGMGVSETIIGRYLKQSGKKLFVATKLGRRQDAPNGWPQNFTYDAMRRHVEDSLHHLDMDQLFLEQLHCIPSAELERGKVFDYLRRLQQEGLIRHFGVSVETADEALICLKHKDVASLQIIFNLFRQHLPGLFFEQAREQGTALIARVPLASGLLSGKFTARTVFDKNDHRNYNANGEAFNAGETFSGIEFGKALELVEKISNILPAAHLAQYSLKWILQHPEITTVIPGASSAAQVSSNVQAATLPPISHEIMAQLNDLYSQEIYPSIRGRF